MEKARWGGGGGLNSEGFYAKQSSIFLSDILYLLFFDPQFDQGVWPVKFLYEWATIVVLHCLHRFQSHDALAVHIVFLELRDHGIIEGIPLDWWSF